MLHTDNRKHIPSKEQMLSSTGENTIDFGLPFCQAYFAGGGTTGLITNAGLYNGLCHVPLVAICKVFML